MENDELAKLFTDVGESIDRRWEQATFALDVFPQIAVEALQGDSPLAMISPDEIYRWVLTSQELPKQHDIKSDFAQPPVTVYATDRFHIAFLFWTTATTSIHQHSFEGAFRVFLGSSLQATYQFTETQRWGDHLLRGQLDLRSVGLLPTGSVCAIEYGPDFIHSVYHLDNPSITLIVRTNGEIKRPTPQYDYEYPGFARNPFLKIERLERAKQILSHLHRIGDPRLPKFVEEALSATDAFGTYQIVNHIRGMIEESALPALFVRISERFGHQLGEALPAMLRGKDRIGRLVAARRVVTDPEARFFLALLLNIPDGTQFRRLLAERFPQSDAGQIISRWVMELLKTNALGIESSSFSAMLVRAMLSGLSVEEAVAKLSPLLRTDASRRAVKDLGAELTYIFSPSFDHVSKGTPPVGPVRSESRKQEEIGLAHQAVGTL